MGLSLVGRLILEWVMVVIAWSLLSLRLWVHYRQTLAKRDVPRMMSDGFLVATGFLLLATMVSMAIKRVKMAHHESVYSKELVKFGPAQGIAYCIGLWLTKGSLMCFYFSLKRYISPAYKKLLISATVFIACTFLVNFLLQFVWCRPFSRYTSFGADYCSTNMDFPPATILYSCNVGSDLLIMGLGLGLLSGLHLARRQKAALLFTVVVGTIPIIASTIRYASIYKFLNDGLSNEVKRRKMEPLEIWSEVDAIFAFYAACLPALRAFIRSKIPQESTAGTAGTFGGGSGSSEPKKRGLWTTTDTIASTLGRDDRGADDNYELLRYDSVNGDPTRPQNLAYSSPQLGTLPVPAQLHQR